MCAKIHSIIFWTWSYCHNIDLYMDDMDGVRIDMSLKQPAETFLARTSAVWVPTSLSTGEASPMHIAWSICLWTAPEPCLVEAVSKLEGYRCSLAIASNQHQGDQLAGLKSQATPALFCCQSLSILSVKQGWYIVWVWLYWADSKGYMKWQALDCTEKWLKSDFQRSIDSSSFLNWVPNPFSFDFLHDFCSRFDVVIFSNAYVALGQGTREAGNHRAPVQFGVKPTRPRCIKHPSKYWRRPCHDSTVDFCWRCSYWWSMCSSIILQKRSSSLWLPQIFACSQQEQVP